MIVLINLIYTQLHLFMRFINQIYVNIHLYLSSQPKISCFYGWSFSLQISSLKMENKYFRLMNIWKLFFLFRTKFFKYLA